MKYFILILMCTTLFASEHSLQYDPLPGATFTCSSVGAPKNYQQYLFHPKIDYKILVDSIPGDEIKILSRKNKQEFELIHTYKSHHI
jgi:hypothetical protein